MAYPLNSGEPRTLYSRTRAEVGGKRLAISPDKRWLAFRENHGGTAVIKLIPAPGGEARELTRIEDGAMTVGGSTFEFTPDSNYLVYGQSADGGDYSKVDLWRVALKGGVPIRMNLIAEGLQGLSFQPKSNRVAFTSGRSVRELWAMENFLPETRAAK